MAASIDADAWSRRGSMLSARADVFEVAEVVDSWLTHKRILQRGDAVIGLEARPPRYYAGRGPSASRLAATYRPSGQTLKAALLILCLAASDYRLTSAAPARGEYPV